MLAKPASRRSLYKNYQKKNTSEQTKMDQNFNNAPEREKKKSRGATSFEKSTSTATVLCNIARKGKKSRSIVLRYFNSG